MSTPGTLGIGAAILFTAISRPQSVPAASSCSILSETDGATVQRCPVSDVPETVAEGTVYRGLAIRGEIRSSNFGVCSALYSQIALNHGDNGSMLAAAWDIDPIRLSWKYDGSICVYRAEIQGDARSMIDAMVASEN